MTKVSVSKTFKFCDLIGKNLPQRGAHFMPHGAALMMAFIKLIELARYGHTTQSQ